MLAHIDNLQKKILDVKYGRVKQGLSIGVNEIDEFIRFKSSNFNLILGHANVGKTTVLKLVDFCLGGSGKSIYTDTEFKKSTHKSIVEDFLVKTKVCVTLELTTDLDDDEALVVTVKKNFLKRKEKVQEIDGEQLNDKDFDMRLKEIILRTSVKKPTFKQVLAKNVRHEKNRLVNTVKVLSQFDSDAVYEVLYLFLLGIPVESLEEKNQYLQKIRTEGKIQTRLKESATISVAGG